MKQLLSRKISSKKIGAKRVGADLSFLLGVRFLLGFLSLLLVLTFAACTHTDASSEQAPSTFRIGYQAVPNAELLAKSLKLAEREFPDVRIKWIPFSSGRNVLLAISRGEIDVGLAGSVPAATAIAQGLPIKVYFIHDIIGDNEALAVTGASKIQSVSDLVDKTIAVPFGSTTHFSLLAAIDQAGVEAARVNIVDRQPAEILSAWKRSKIDGSFIWQPILGQIVEDSGKTILTARELAARGAVTADLGIVSQTFADSYPEFLASYVGVLDQAVQRYQNDPQRAAAAIAPNIGLSTAETLSVMREILWLGAAKQLSEAYMGTAADPGALSQVLQASAEFMASQNAIPPPPELAVFQAGLLSQVVEQAVQQSQGIKAES